MREKLACNNRYAAAEVASRLLEAQRRGYWNATEEEMEKLRDAYMEREGEDRRADRIIHYDFSLFLKICYIIRKTYYQVRCISRRWQKVQGE
jgi:cobalamin biosynthesis Mg chelatase CobN